MHKISIYSITSYPQLSLSFATFIIAMIVIIAIPFIVHKAIKYKYAEYSEATHKSGSITFYVISIGLIFYTCLIWTSFDTIRTYQITQVHPASSPERIHHDKSSNYESYLRYSMVHYPGTEVEMSIEELVNQNLSKNWNMSSIKGKPISSLIHNVYKLPNLPENTVLFAKEYTCVDIEKYTEILFYFKIEHRKETLCQEEYAYRRYIIASQDINL